MTEHDIDPAPDPDSDAMFARAVAALRAPHADDAVGVEAVLRRVRTTPSGRIPRGGVRMPWWAAVAAAAIAFAVGLGVGRTDNRPNTRRTSGRRRVGRAADRLRLRRTRRAKCLARGRLQWMGRRRNAAASHRWPQHLVGRRSLASGSSRLRVRGRRRDLGRRSAGSARSGAVVRAAKLRYRGRRGPPLMMIRLLGVAALVVMARGALAQDPRLRSALDAETLAKVTRLTDSARAESLPIDPLVGVALEGAQRHAPGAADRPRCSGLSRCAARGSRGARDRCVGARDRVGCRCAARRRTERCLETSPLGTTAAVVDCTAGRAGRSARAWVCHETRRPARSSRRRGRTRAMRISQHSGGSSNRTSSPAHHRRRRRCFACATSAASRHRIRRSSRRP